MPKSTRQISPGSVLFIVSFHGIKHLESFQRPLIAFSQGCGVFLSLDNTAHNLPPIRMRELRNFRDNFRSAHIMYYTLISPVCAGKFVSLANPLV